MALVDRTIQVQASPSRISEAIKTSIGSNDQLIVSRPDTLLISLQQNMGYVYLLRPQENGETLLRLIADTAREVREAFRGKSPKDALTILTSSTTNPTADDQIAMTAANAHLDTIKQSAERQPMPTTSSPQSALSVVDNAAQLALSPLPSAGDPNISAIFARKPLPSNDAPNRLPAGEPWNPDRLTTWAFFFSPAAGIGMALNWRKLGKPQWMWPTIITSIAIPVVAIAIPLILISLFPRAATSFLTVILLFFGANWGFIYGLWFLQRGAYKTWDNTGDAGKLLSYEYSFTNAAIVGVCITLAALVFGIVTFYFNSRPNTFDSQEVTITYPNSWRIQNNDQVPNCKLANVHCIVVLSDARFGFTSIFLISAENTAGLSASSAESQSWELVKSKYPRATLVNRDTTTVSTLKGYRRYYKIPQENNPDEDRFGMQIYFVKGSNLYELTAESLNEGIFHEQFPDIQQFITGIRMK